MLRDIDMVFSREMGYACTFLVVRDVWDIVAQSVLLYFVVRVTVCLRQVPVVNEIFHK